MDAERVRYMEDTAIAKIVLLGDAGVGKTSILHQYQLKSFRPSPDPTVGVLCNSIIVQTRLGVQQIQIWDTAGQERYRSLVPMYARSASAALIVLDTSIPESTESAQHWIKFVHQNCPSQCLAFLVANKVDLPRMIDWDGLTAMSQESDFPIIQTTATQYMSIANLFEQVAEAIAKKARELPSVDFIANVAIQLPYSEKKEECC
jgi:Ras-related protein Rab-5C